SSRAKASLILLIGKCSFCGAILCLEAKSSIVAMAPGEPVGEPETLRCCEMSENAGTGIGSSTAPTSCSRPLGARVPIIASQSSFTPTVLIRRSKVPPSFLIATDSLVETAWFAPKPFASSDLAPARGNPSPPPPGGGGDLTSLVPHPADPDDAYPVSRLGVHRQRREDGNAPAQQRSGFGEVQLFRQLNDPSPMRTDV